jgi:pantoate--beta-alanine ligase
MLIINHVKDMQSQMKQMKNQQLSIGFVPTMGYLHEGHMSLIKQARKNNDIVVLSIFVNPLQFGPNEDFDTYPRDFKRDEELAKSAGVDIIFYPKIEDMYPSKLTFQLNVTSRVDVLCGASRPGHFDGVVTVLIKLFNIVMPDRAYFGMKDAQQVAVVEGFVTDLNFPLEVVRCEIIREEDGLAKSSRNVRLLEQERKQAPVIYESLTLAKLEIENGVKEASIIKGNIIQMIEEKTSGIIDYVEILTYPSLRTLNELEGTVIIAVAVQFSHVRLIDNITITI